LGGRFSGGLGLTVVERFELCGGDVGVLVGYFAVQASVVEPVDVAEGGVFDFGESRVLGGR
jgi:hypothetical protein